MDTPDQLDELTRERLSAPHLSSTLVLRREVPALAVLCAGLVFTVVVEQQQRARAEQVAAASFERRAVQVSMRVARAFDGPLHSLYGYHHALERFRPLAAAELSEYAAQLAQDQPALTGVHYLQYVTTGERAAFEARSGCPLTELVAGGARPAAARSEYLPIAALGPWEPRTLCGHDRLDNTLLKARDTGQVVVSVLSEQEAREPTLALAAAVCDQPLTAAACAPYKLRGVVELWLRVSPLMENVKRDLADERLHFRVYDLSAPQDRHLLYASTPDPYRTATPFGAGHATDIALADRWLRVVVLPEADASRASPRLATLASGAALSLLMSLLFSAAHTLRSLRLRLSEARQLGPYTLEAEIGQGASGNVYRAHHALLRRPTAVKLLRRDRINARTLQRFEREVQQTAGLCHPNTIAIYDYGRTRDDIFYYAMEYLDGIDLQRLVSTQGRQPPGRVLCVLTQVCGALEEAHGLGLIHRDIKPANLMLCVRGGVYDFVKVLDFGLVRNLGDPVELQRNAFVGTPLYAAPEAYLQPQRVNARTDLYSLGATAFFLLTGRAPFLGVRVLDVLEQHVSARAPSFEELGVYDVPAALQALVHECLAKDPDARPMSARALRERLTAMQTLTPWSEQDRRRAWNGYQNTPITSAGEGATDDAALGATELGPQTP